MSEKTIALPAGMLRQHLIDPELCIRCSTCEDTCPAEAVSNDGTNFVVDAAICNSCAECILPCPTGSIDKWRIVPIGQAYSLEDQFSWTVLPEPSPADAAAGVGEAHARSASDAAIQVVEQLYGRSHPATARVVVNDRVTTVDAEGDIRHLTLDLTSQDFPVLEGQSIGILPPGVDADGRTHAMRLYSVASPRGGEAAQAGHVALTVKRVPGGIGSSHLCDLAVGDTVQVLGPYGVDFLMPRDAAAPLLMVCTGTGIAPMRAMILQRLLHEPADGGPLHLFYGSRHPGETAYVDELTALAAAHPGRLHLHWAWSRQAGQPRRFVQDALAAQQALLADVLKHAAGVIYLCGLEGMEAGVFEAIDAACRQHGLNWAELRPALVAGSRLHVETY